MIVNDLVDYVVKLKGAALNQDEGVLYGDPKSEVSGVLLTWMATVPALEAAAREGCNVVLCHESFYLYSFWGGLQPQHPAWVPNQARLRAAAAGGLAILRVHGSLDKICVYDDFAAALGLENPDPGTGWHKVLAMPETTVRELVERVKSTFGLPHVRVSGDLDQHVSCAGLPWGGLGLDSNISYIETCIELGADVLIAGEADEYGFTFANDAGVPMIETGHSISENIGMKNFGERLSEELPGLRTVFFEATRPFRFA